MKKKFLAIAAIAIMIPLVLCACKKEKPVEPTQPATQEASVEPETKSAPTEDPKAAVVRLIDNVNTLKYVHGVALDCDYDYVWYDEYGYSYVKVTDPDFQSIGDINAFLFETFTAQGAKEYYPDLALMGQEETYPYSYVIVQGDEDVPDGLYELEAGLGFYIYEIVSDIEISNQTENSFTADFTVEYYGQWVVLTMGVVGERESDGSIVWKVDSIVENWEY